MSLEDMSAKFNYPLTHHARDKVAELKPGAKKGRPAASQETNGAADGTEDGTEEYGK